MLELKHRGHIVEIEIQVAIEHLRVKQVTFAVNMTSCNKSGEQSYNPVTRSWRSRKSPVLYPKCTELKWEAVICKSKTKQYWSIGKRLLSCKRQMFHLLAKRAEKACCQTTIFYSSNIQVEIKQKISLLLRIQLVKKNTAQISRQFQWHYCKTQRKQSCWNIKKSQCKVRKRLFWTKNTTWKCASLTLCVVLKGDHRYCNSLLSLNWSQYELILGKGYWVKLKSGFHSQ